MILAVLLSLLILGSFMENIAKCTITDLLAFMDYFQHKKLGSDPNARFSICEVLKNVGYLVPDIGGS